MQAATKSHLDTAAIWIARLLVGGMFIISGWAKAVDPWGFLIKVNEYLAAWGLELPRELVLTGCVALACVEFCTGVLVAVGSLKRVAVWVVAAMMAVMLPLTLYIAVAEPVSDCGCFGDFLVISNWATFGKNVVLTTFIIFLCVSNRRTRGFYPAPIQWLVVVVSLAFPMFMAFAGYHVQPLVDFRPYKVGTPFFAEETADEASVEYLGGSYIYEKDGERRSFDLSSLPDGTWTFVGADETAAAFVPYGFEVRDAEGYDVSDDLSTLSQPVLYLIVTEPDMQFLSHMHFANRLNEYAQRHGIAMVGIAGASGARLDAWLELAKPHFPVYSAEDTSLKQLVRGDAALVYVDAEGIIRWKRTLASLDEGIVERADDAGASLAEVYAVDKGEIHAVSVGICVLLLLVIYLLGLSPKILRLFVRRPEKNA